MNRAFATLGVFLLVLVALIILWAQTGQEQGAAVLVIKQTTIALLLLLAFATLLWLMKSLLDSAMTMDERESGTMRVREGENNKLESRAAGKLPPVEAADKPVDTQAEIDRIRAMISEDPEKVAQIVKRWIGPGE